MDLFTYLLGKKGQNTQRDLFSYLLGKGAGGSGTYVNFSGTSLNISNTLRARIKNIELKGATSQDGTPTPEAPIPIKVVTGEQNVKIGTTNYPLSLGSIELAKIGTYQDYIYGSPNNWYKYKYIQKVIFDGTEEWVRLVENTNTVQFRNYPELAKYKGLYNVISNLFKTYSGNVEEECILGQSANTGLQIIINKTRANTSADFKTWLSTHNVTAYYELNTPTQEQITDTTLIEQLNNLYNATSQEGTTIITCTSGSSDNETIVFSGDIKVASVGLGNPLNISLLSSNIQEETNINDIQEEPNVDEVNEIEDIEQNNEPIEEPIEEEVS